MNEMKTLADQLRSKMSKPDTPEKEKTPAKKKSNEPAETPQIVDSLRGYDITGNKSLVHARFDAQTAQLLHHFKLATGIENTRVICYAVRQLLDKHPEIKTLVKEHLEKLEL